MKRNQAPEPDPASENLNAVQQALSKWWLDVTDEELAMLLPKVEEYSAYDLELIGTTMADTIGWSGELTTAAATEIGISFYVLGKMGRVMGAIREGRLPSEDTWMDLAVYSRMALRAKQAGSWPGNPNEKDNN